MKYEDMKLSQPIKEALAKMDFLEATPIQAQAIPIGIEGKDILGQSETGSGKTAAFGVPIAERCIKGAGIQAVILGPTRELVVQIAHVLRRIVTPKGLHVASIYGGVAINPQIDKLMTAEIVVGTPGRMLDHLDRQTMDLSKIRIAVLDEADKMFEMGFIEDVERIFSAMPTKKQSMLFSATIGTEIRGLAERRMHDPVTISTQDFVEKKFLKQFYYDVPRNKKFSLLVHIFKQENPRLAIIFCGTRRETDFVETNLVENGIVAKALHGGLTQVKRERVMDDFRNNSIHALVATDVAARGLDISNVTHIFNYSIPSTSKEYIHRIGRTARMGAEGKAISLLDDNDYDNFNAVLSDHSIQVTKMEAPDFPRAKVGRRPSMDQGRGPMGRGSRGPPRRDGPPRGRGSYGGGRMSGGAGPRSYDSQPRSSGTTSSSAPSFGKRW
ncbi:MAG: DEAD/DEAH box helicase [archaeon]